MFSASQQAHRNNILPSVAIFTKGPGSTGAPHPQRLFNPIRVCVVSGLLLLAISTASTAQVFPSEYELTLLLAGDGSAGVAFNGIIGAGTSVSLVGDVNGDGVDDLIIGASEADPNGLEEAGQSYIVFGRGGVGGFPAEFELSSLLEGDGSVGIVLNGSVQQLHSGVTVSAGDVNGDGLDDVLIGGSGSVFVVYGRDAATSGFPATIELDSLSTGNGGMGFAIQSMAAPREGFAAISAGDINGDGIDDILLGANASSPGGVFRAGSVYVIYGRYGTADTFPPLFDLSRIPGGDGSEGFVLNGSGNADTLGEAIAVGDVNGDGIQDLIAGASGANLANPADGDSPGATYVLYGRTAASGGFPAQFSVSSLQTGDGSDGFVLTGFDRLEESGTGVAAGDVNGDDVDDIVVGATGFGEPNFSRRGRATVIFGRDDAVVGFPAVLPLASVPAAGGTIGFAVTGEEFDDHAGEQVAVADVNDDGIGDLVIGAARANPDGTNRGRNDAGKNYVIYGRAAGDTFPAELDLTSITAGDGSDGFAIYGISRNDGVFSNIYGGLAISDGDLNGDGIADLALARPGVDFDDRFEAGAVYVLFGRRSGLPTLPELRITNTPAAVEGDYLQFKIRLSHPVSENVTFDVATTDGTATAPGDYEAKGGSRLLAPGETARTLWVRTVDDASREPNETLRLRLTNPENATLGRSSAGGKILDNDEEEGLAELRVMNARAAEGERARFQLILSRPTNEDVKFAVETIDVSARANADYAPKGGTRVIPAGETSATINVEIAEDDLVEGVEKFRLRIEARSNNVVVQQGEATATGTITGP